MATETFIVLEVVAVGLREAITGLDFIDESLRDRESLIRALHSAADEQIPRLVAATPVRTGQMRNAWGMEPADTGQPYHYQINIYNDAPHARYVIEGTGLFGRFNQMIIPTTRPFSFIDEFGLRRVIWRSRGQRRNEALNQLLDVDIRDTTVRAAEREVRGLMGIAFLRPGEVVATSPLMLVEGAEEL